MLESSPFDQVRRLARDVRSGYAEMCDAGVMADGAQIASAEHLRELVELMDES